MNSLTHIDDVEPLTEKDEPVVREITEVLRKHNALERFGLTLLHQHFDINEDEILIEETDVTSRSQRISPQKEAAVANLPSIETAWRLDSGEPVATTACIIFPNQGHVNIERPSDVKLKVDVSPIEAALDSVHRLRPVMYTHSDQAKFLPRGRHIGLIAQEVEQVFPELVSHAKEPPAARGYKTVDYVGLVPVLVAAINEQQTIISRLSERLDRLGT